MTPRSRLLLPMVLPPLQGLEDVGMPGFRVCGKGSLVLPSAVNVAESLVEDPKHREDAVAGTIGAADMRARCGDVRDGRADSTCELGGMRELL